MYDRILAAFHSHPWAILPDKLAAIRGFLYLKARGGDVPPEQIAEAMAGRRSDGVQMAGRVAVLPIQGVIAQRVGAMEKASGGVSAEEIGSTLDSLVADRSVKAIVMAYDSPGGSVAGIPELAAKIRAARDQKKVIALASSTAASAAFWLAAQASEFYVEPGGVTGSVGVITAHEDVSAQMEKEGVKATLITSSQYKGEGSPYAPLSAEAQANMQQLVNRYHSMFVADLAKGRGVTAARVESDFGQGRVKIDRDAVAAGMADGVATLAQLLNRLGAGDSARAESVTHVNALRAAARARAVSLDD